MARLGTRSRAPPQVSNISLYLRLALAAALVLAPGWAVARALGVRTLSATLAWAFAVLFAALGITFLLESSLTLTMALLAVTAIVALSTDILLHAKPEPPIPGRWLAAGGGAAIGILLWSVAGTVQGDGLFHLARVRKLLEFDELSLGSVGEFEDASLHPGYAFPLWHGFLALIARLAGTDPEQVVLHLPSVLAIVAVLVAYEAGWALFQRTWAAGAVAGAQVALICFSPGKGGAYAFLSLPATSSRQLLVPAALALALTAMRTHSAAVYASAAAAAFALAVVHPTYAIFLWIPFAGFLFVRALWTKEDVRAGLAALGALAIPASLFLLWLVPIASDTVSVSPDADELQRAFEQYRGQLNVRSDTSYSLAAEVFTRSGPVAIAALLLIPLAVLAARRRWSAFVVGGSLAVFAFMLIPLLFVALSDLVSISQARRAAGFLPFAFAFAGGLGVLSRLVWPWLPPLALVAGALLQWQYPGDFDYVLDDPGPSWVVWVSVGGAVLALVVGFVRRMRPPLEANAGLAAALFLAPVVAVGLTDWNPVPPPPASTLSDGLVDALRSSVPERAIVYSDQETSYRIAAYAPLYVAVAPPGHVASTEKNRPFARAADARKFLATGDLTIPRRYGAQYLVVDRLRMREPIRLPELYRDARFVLYRMPP
jgi:hypothetical protein